MVVVISNKGAAACSYCIAEYSYFQPGMIHSCHIDIDIQTDHELNIHTQDNNYKDSR